MRERKLRKKEDGREYLNVSEASEFLGYTEGTLRQYIFGNRVPYYKNLKGEIRFSKEELQKWQKKKKEEKKPVVKFDIDEDKVYKEDNKLLLNILKVLIDMQQNLREVSAELEQQRD